MKGLAVMCNCKNVGGVDRVLRGVIGVVALVLAFTTLGAMELNVLGMIAAVVGAVMLLTALIGFCPAYLPLRLSTCRMK